MRLAQQLYEGIPIKGHGTIGLITYLRTDSIRVSEEAKENAKASWEDAKLSPKARQEKMQAERETMKAEAKLRLEEANERISAAKEYRKK